MEVQCDRCKTEYDFDDALVSERGTTVRCTNCGFQFRVRRSLTPAPGDVVDVVDEWVVRTPAGTEHVFTTLRDLQRGIASRLVGRDAVLTGRGEERPLGAIAELVPFFDGRVASRPPPRNAPSGSPPPPRAVGTSSAPPPVVVPLARRPMSTLSGIGDGSVGPRGDLRRVPTLRPPVVATPSPSAVPDEPPTVRRVTDPDAPTRPLPERDSRSTTDLSDSDIVSTKLARVGSSRSSTPPPIPGAPAIAAMELPIGHPAGGELSRLAPPVSARFDTSDAPPPPVGTPIGGGFGSVRPSARPGAVRSFRPPPGELSLPPDPFPPDHLPGRSRVGGWVVAVVLLASAATVGVVVTKPWVRAPKPVAAAPALDPRAEKFLAEGEAALVAGSLESAQESFDKASALAERDTRVLVALARVAAVRADEQWLRLRALPPDATDEVSLTRKSLAELTHKAKRRADDAVAAAPEEVAATRAKIDALRIGGEQGAARTLAARISGGEAQPETAYVLAALDLAETEPLWTTVLARLRTAAAAESNLGRARAALVYALARAGDGAAAKQELEKLGALSRPHPALSALRAFVDKAPLAKPDAGPPLAVRGPSEPTVPGTEPTETPTPTDTRQAVQLAQAAHAKGDNERARTLYEAAVAKNPADSEALAGLGDVARAQRDANGAQRAYRRALQVNPTYLPALLGLGDVQWETGDHAAAQRTYKEIVDRFPEGTYPPRAKTRAEGPTPPPTPTPTPTATAPVPTATATATATATPENTAPPPPPVPAPTTAAPENP